MDSSLEFRVRKAADAKALELGFQPEQCQRQIFQKPGPVDQPFLDEEGITERRHLWVVNYDPNLQGAEGEEVAVAGGDLTIYVDVRTVTVVAAWLGE